MTITADTAAFWASRGMTVVPLRTDGQKRPSVKWTEYQDRKPTEAEIAAWFAPGRTDGLGTLTGAISGQLEMFELEGRAAHMEPELAQAMADNGLGQVWETINTGYREQSPSGGIHWLYRVDGQARPNTKLARRPATPEELAENPQEKIKVLIETRGEGGFTVLAPSHGRSHPTGQPWIITAGTPDTIPTISAGDRDALYAIATMFDRMPVIGRTPPKPHDPNIDPGERPGDDYNARTTWDDILTPAGWNKAKRIGKGYGWCRPGKKPVDGISATTGQGDTDNLYVFSTSTEFEAEVPYTKFGAYALLHHGGDFSAAASALRADNYGKEPSVRVEHFDPTAPFRLDTQWPTNPAPTATAPAPATTATLPKPATPAAAPAWDDPWPMYPSPQQEPSPATPAGNPSDTSTEPTSSSPPEIPDSNSSSTETTPTAPDTPASSTPTTADPSAATSTQTTSTPPKPFTPAYTDDGNAAMLLDRHGHLLRFNHDSTRWHVWNGKAWKAQPANGGAAKELAKDAMRRLEADDQTARNHKKKSLSNAGITAVLAMAQTDQRIAVAMGEFDAQPYQLNTPDGIVDLTTGQLGPHDPVLLHTRSTACGYNPDQPTPGWHNFLNTTFGGNQEMIGYFRRVCGYAITGEVKHHILPFLRGNGQNGKSVAMNVLMHILGEYAGPAPRGMLLAGPERHETEIARLSGMRLVVASEVNEKDAFDEAKVKLLTGGDILTARFMNKDHFSFTPTHTLFVMGNYEPRVTSGGDSFWRRLRYIPFEHKVPDEQKIDGLEKILVREEGPGILAWMVQGAIEAERTGLQDPEAVRAATDNYAAEEDVLARFLEECCHLGPAEHLQTNTALVRKAYVDWCRTNHETELSAQAFGRQMRSRGIGQQRTGGQRFYTGIALLTDRDSSENGHWTDR